MDRSQQAVCPAGSIKTAKPETAMKTTTLSPICRARRWLALLAVFALVQAASAQLASFKFTGDFSGSGERTIDLLNDVGFELTSDLSANAHTLLFNLVLDEIVQDDDSSDLLIISYSSLEVKYSIQRSGVVVKTGTIEVDFLRDNSVELRRGGSSTANDGVMEFTTTLEEGFEAKSGDRLILHAFDSKPIQGFSWNVKPNFNKGYNNLTFTGSLFLVSPLTYVRISRSGEVIEPPAPASPPVITRVGFNGSDDFEVEAGNLQIGTTYILQRAADLASGTAFDDEADSATPTGETHTFTDQAPPVGKAFYRVQEQ